MRERPEVQTDGRADVDPRQAAIGEARLRRPHRIAGRQVTVVRRHGELTGADPELQQPWIDVDERRAPGAGEEPGVHRVVEVQNEIRPAQHVFGFRPAASNEVRTGAVQERPALEPEPFHPLHERREHRGTPLGIAGRAELLQPIDLTPQAAQAQGVLQVNPEMAAAVGETGDLVDRHHHRAHAAPSGAATGTASPGRSRKPMSWISRARMPSRTRASHSVRTSTSRSAT